MAVRRTCEPAHKSAFGREKGIRIVVMGTKDGRMSRRIGSNRTKATRTDAKPDYAELDAKPANAFLMDLFKRKMVHEIGEDTQMVGYEGLIDLTRALNGKYGTPKGTQEATRRILKSLFPSWLPSAFAAMFSRPMPELSCRLNAWVTALTCQWLMGPCEVNDVDLGNGKLAKGQGVFVERCRYLEESGPCVSVCVNSCKIPTQEFFEKDMGLPLEMVPNYEDYSCQFRFGCSPPPPDEDKALTAACFTQCPSASKCNEVCHKI